jgi:hypothetical protein
MWLFLNDAFLSIVSYADNPDALLVRARHWGDIEQMFPKAKVSVTPNADYLFRATVPRRIVAAAIGQRIPDIDYSNFKGSVVSDDRHHAYLAVWQEMFWWQRQHTPPPPLPQQRSAKSPHPRKAAAKKPRRKLTRFPATRASNVLAWNCPTTSPQPRILHGAGPSREAGARSRGTSVAGKAGSGR